MVTILRTFIFSRLVQVLAALVGAFMFVTIPAVLQWSITGFNVFILENKTAEEFVFYRQPVDSVSESYLLGEAPKFNFIRTYGVAGKIDGENTIRCENWRSDIYSAGGFVEQVDVGSVDNAQPNPFVWGGNLPTEPQELCVMSSVITLCDEKYDVCKTVKTVSEVFRFE